jgi:hypothetical protein
MHFQARNPASVRKAAASFDCTLVKLYSLNN